MYDTKWNKESLNKTIVIILKFCHWPVDFEDSNCVFSHLFDVFCVIWCYLFIVQRNDSSCKNAWMRHATSCEDNSVSKTLTISFGILKYSSHHAHIYLHIYRLIIYLFRKILLLLVSEIHETSEWIKRDMGKIKCINQMEMIIRLIRLYYFFLAL